MAGNAAQRHVGYRERCNPLALVSVIRFALSLPSTGTVAIREWRAENGC
jgi:hypothetical protein